MAEIRTAIHITDGMTPAFKSMSNALNIVMSNFASLQNQSSQAINTNSIIAARRELFNANSAIEEMERSLQSTANAQRNLNNEATAGRKIFDGLKNKITGMLAAYASWQGASQLITLTDSYADITSRLSLMVKEGETFEEVQKMIRDSAKETFSDYKMTADAVGKMGIQAGRAFSNTEDVVNFVGQLNRHLAISGTNTAAAQGAMVQLTQGMAAGVLRGEELNSVLEGMPTVANTIEKYFNKMGDNRALKQIAEDGLITAEIVKQALYDAADETNEAFSSMNYTFRDIWNRFTLFADEAMEPVYKKLVSLTNSKQFHAFAASAGQAFSILADILVWTFDAIAAAGAFIAENWSYVEPIIVTVTLATLAYGAALAWSNRQKAIDIFLTGLSVTKKWLYAAATFVCTLATSGFSAAVTALNTVLALSPIGLFVLAVVVLIGILYLAVAAVNYFADTNISATGIIVAAFFALGTYIYNVVIYLVNLFMIFVEFLVNVFKNPLAAIKRLFINLAINFLNAVISMTKGWDGFATAFANAMITAINWVIGAWNSLMDMLPDKVKSALNLGKGTELGYTVSITSDLEDARDKLETMKGETPDDYWEAPRFEYKNIGESAAKGYNIGKKFSEGFGADKLGEDEEEKGPKSADEMLKNAGLGAGSPANQLGKDAAGGKGGGKGSAGGDGATEKTAQKINNSIQGTDEELRMLREVAEREAINRFTTAEIKVDMKNNNNINSSLDLDGIIGDLSDKLYTAMSSAAEGIHVF